MSTLRRVLVIGGNGFIGSAVCKAALARGMEVSSISSSGRPYRTEKGHSPAWVSKVDWQAGDALHPESFAHLLPNVRGVVHTLGTLLEGGQYKNAIREGNIFGLVGSFLQIIGGKGGNPLEKSVDSERKGSYQTMNRDAALRVCEAFLASSPSATDSGSRPFVHVSAEDIFRPIIPAGYIESKRDAEMRIDDMMRDKVGFHAVHIRPSLVYHAHHRPLTTPPAVLLDLSASLHSKIPPTIPSPSGTFRALGNAFYQKSPSSITASPFESIANALTIPPIHVDHVAEAICVALDEPSDVRGVVGVRRMRELLGWSKVAT